jgi:hypothetical protein
MPPLQCQRAFDIIHSLWPEAAQVNRSGGNFSRVVTYLHPESGCSKVALLSKCILTIIIIMGLGYAILLI